MIKNYILTALRNLTRHKVYAVINIGGLAVGLTLTILLFSFIRYELSYEDFNSKKDRIYRSVSRIKVSEDRSIQGPMVTGFAHDWAIDEIPEIESAVRLDPRPGEVFYNDKIFRGYTGFYTDTNFFEFFDLKFKYGNEKTALKPGTVMLTEKLANVIFKNEKPIGKTIDWRGNTLEVTAVLKDLPKNTHLSLDLLAPLSVVSDLESYYKSRGISIYSYYLFKEGANTPENIKKAEELIQKKTNEYFADMGVKVNHSLQNLGEIHLHSEGLQFSMRTPGSMKTIYILSILAFFIVVIAVINYINLETSRAETRSLEVGIRKVSGAHRKNLVGQFIGESLLTVLISFLLAIGLAELFSGGFENLVNREFSHQLYTPVNLAIYFGLALLIGFVAGFYPAIYLSSYRPSVILKSASGKGKANSALRVALVVTQFSIASFLIISLLMVYSQIQYAKNKDLGFDQEQVVVVKNLTDGLEDDYSLIKNELSTIPAIENITAATAFPGRPQMHNTLRKDKNSEGVMAQDNIVKDGYDKTLGLKMKQGRYFSEEYEDDGRSYVINEQAAKMLGLENPVGKTVYHNETEARIIGVMENYHVESIREEIMPVMHSQRSDWYGYILVKIQRDNIQQTLEAIESRLTNIDSEYVFNYQFLDDYFDSLYKEEERMNKTSMYSAFIAIFIALLGLYALTSFVVIKKRKEIGIRKAMGSTVGEVVVKIIKDINKWVLLANIIAWPLAFYFIRQWLENFAFRIDISVWYFIAGTMIAFVFALLVVVVQAYSAASENPAYTLRDE